MADNKNKKETLPALELGKVPPQSIDTEIAVLGAIMLEQDALIVASEILKAESFYKEAHQRIFKAIITLSQKEEPVDVVTVTDELRKTGDIEKVGGGAYVAQITARVASAAHIEYHARIIQQKYIQRELIRVSSMIQEKAFDENEDVDDLLNFSENELFQIAEGNIKKDVSAIGPILKEAIKQIEESAKKEDGLTGVPSGFTGIDRITNGWQPSDLVIIAARPSMGKTAFVLSMARNMAVDHKRPVVVFSLEMSSIQLVNRLITSESEISGEKIRSGRLEPYEWKQLEVKVKKLGDAPIYIDDTPAMSIFEMKAKCRRLKDRYDIQAVVIDYLQLMTAGVDMRGNREQEVSTISRSLKAIAKELSVPVLALSQLNRSVETRGGDKKPQLSDLRESGAIEQDADMVLFIHRPEYYKITEDEEGNDLRGIGQIIIAKHRNGSLGEVNLRFVGQFAKFKEAEGDFGFGEVAESQANMQKLSSKMNDGDSGIPGDDIPANSDFDQQGAPGEDAPF